jgi:hypothetical protein
MKYIKEYKIFESSSIEDMINDIEDILLPISDMGYNPYVQEIQDPNDIVIRIVSYGDKLLEVTDEVKSEFDRLNDYLESRGYSISLVRGVREGTNLNKFPMGLDSTYDEFSKYLERSLEKSFQNLLFVVKPKK